MLYIGIIESTADSSRWVEIIDADSEEAAVNCLRRTYPDLVQNPDMEFNCYQTNPLYAGPEDEEPTDDGYLGDDPREED